MARTPAKAPASVVIKWIAVAVGVVALMLIVIGLFVFLALSNPGVL
jgi:hypothetical protein